MINTGDVVDILKKTDAVGEWFTFNDEQYILTMSNYTANHDRITLTFKKATHTISPCPFCKSADVYMEVVDSLDGYFVVCRSCESEGPMGTKQQAITKWNQAQA